MMKPLFAIGISFLTSAALAQKPPAPAPTPKTSGVDYSGMNFGTKMGPPVQVRMYDTEPANPQAAPEETVSRKKKSSKTAKKTKPAETQGPHATAGEPSNKAATTELILPPQDKTPTVLPSPATVRSTVNPVENPVERPSFEVGLSIQPYQPSGTVKLPALDAYQLDNLGARPMVGIEVRWLPLKLDTDQPIAIGPYVAGGYAQNPVSMTSPTGVSLENTKLNSFRGEAGGAIAWQPQRGSKWGLRLDLGLGQFSIVQSSDSSFANHSASESYATAGLFGEVRISNRFAFFVGYDYRMPVANQPDEINLQRSNIMAGITGGFH